MTPKHFLTLATIANLIYGFWYFLSPQGAANVYGFGAITTPLSNTIFQFLGIMFIAEGVMCGVAVRAEASLGRTAVLVFVAVSSLLCSYMDVLTVMGQPGTMDYVDLGVNLFFGAGGVYFVVRERNTFKSVG